MSDKARTIDTTVEHWAPNSAARHHVFFAVFLFVTVAIGWKFLAALASYALDNDSASHILLVPFIALFIAFVGRRDIFGSQLSWSTGFGSITVVAGLLSLFWFYQRSPAEGSLSFSLSGVAVVATWIGGFGLCYGWRAAHSARFSLLFLLLLVPWPEPLLSRVVHLLQSGSTEIAYLLFKISGVPVLRSGFVLALPGVTIRVAEECSSIRSSIALFITCLLTAHLYLRRVWTTWIFVALALLFSVVKNGIRIATLTMLSIYVNPAFLRGSLHRDGGILFFLLALLMLWPALRALQRSEESFPWLSVPSNR
jgi:exosortase